MKVFTMDKIIYHFSPTNPPIGTVSLGEEFLVETNDCYSGQIKTEKDLRPNIDISIMDAATGPIGIAETAPGDVICVDVKEIQLNNYGIMPTSPHLGPLGDKIIEANTKIIPIVNGFAQFLPSLKIPLTPMIGVLGVAPNAGCIHCATPGDHGANMDTKDITKGSKVYLPVFVPGANLAVSDLHACMGDGELCGTGIETMGKVRLKVTKVLGLSLRMPVVETNEYFMVISSDKGFDITAKKGILYATELISAVLKITFPDAYRLMSATCDLKVSQIVNPLITLRVAIPKYVLKFLV